MRWQGLLIGTVGLAVLEAVLTRSGGTAQVGGWLETAGNLVTKFISPAVPAFNTTPAAAAPAPVVIPPSGSQFVPPPTKADPNPATNPRPGGTVSTPAPAPTGTIV